MKLTIRPIGTQNVNRAIAAISKLSGARLEDVVEHEAERVIEGAIRLTTAARIASIRDRENFRDFRTLDAGTGRKTYYLRNRYPDRIWRKIEAARKASLQRRLRARGLAKRSWLALADAIGLSVNAPGYVRKAVPSTGRTYPGNATVRRRTGQKPGLYFANRQPTAVQFAGGRSALLRALNGRTGYFHKSLKKGAFENLGRIARAYPGLRIRR